MHLVSIITADPLGHMRMELITSAIFVFQSYASESTGG